MQPQNKWRERGQHDPLDCHETIHRKDIHKKGKYFALKHQDSEMINQTKSIRTMHSLNVSK